MLPGSKNRRRSTLRHVLLLDRLYPLLALALKDVGQIPQHRFAKLVARLRRVGSEQRGHDGGPVHLGDGLREGLKEVLKPVHPRPVLGGLRAGVHHHLVEQDQRRASIGLLLAFDHLDQERLRGSGVAFLCGVVAVQDPESVGACKLEGEDVPRVPQRTGLAAGCAHVRDSLLHVDLVEAERRGRGFGEFHVGVLSEFANGLEVREAVRIAKEMMQGDERVRLAATVGHLQLADRLVALSRQPRGHVPGQIAEREGGIRQGEELLGVFVQGAPSGPACHLVEVGGELGQR